MGKYGTTSTRDTGGQEQPGPDQGSQQAKPAKTQQDKRIQGGQGKPGQGDRPGSGKGDSDQGGQDK